MTDEEKRCDPEDIMCQMQILGYLKGLQGVLGEDKFKAKYPEFEGLGETVAERMKEQETTIREAFEKCGMKAPEEEIGEGGYSEPEE